MSSVSKQFHVKEAGENINFDRVVLTPYAGKGLNIVLKHFFSCSPDNNRII